MNALVSIDLATLTPATVFAPGGVEGIISKIEAEVSAEVFDIATAEGRERIKSVAYKVARSKTALDDMGKELVSGIKAQAAGIDADRRTIRDRLDALKERVRGPLTAWEEAEANRVDAHERALVSIIESPRFAATVPSANVIDQRIAEVRTACARDWQEFHERADTAATEALATLETMLATAKQAEADAAELAELRQLKAEREEADRKAEAERIAAQQAAERQAYEERRERERAEKAKRDQEAAVAAAVEAERVKAEREKAAAIEAEKRRQEQERVRVAEEKARAELAERKRQENKRHREKVHGTIKDALSDPRIGIDTETANRMIAAIIAGNVPHLSINY